LDFAGFLCQLQCLWRSWREASGDIMGNFDETVGKLGAKKVAIRRDGKTQRITTTEALMLKQHESALKGSPMAQRASLEAIRRAEERSDAVVAERRLALMALKDRSARLIKKAQAEGRSAADILPHPDDIILDGSKGGAIVGPMDAEDALRMDRICQFRDTLFLQSALEDRLVSATAHEPSATGGTLLLALYLNSCLPPSRRLSKQGELHHLCSAGRGMTLRALTLTCRKAWHSLGMRSRRGATLGHKEDVITFLNILGEFVTANLAAAGDREDEAAALHQVQLRLAEEMPRGLRPLVAPIQPYNLMGAM
jgi:hypothetical protein